MLRGAINIHRASWTEGWAKKKSAEYYALHALCWDMGSDYFFVCVLLFLVKNKGQNHKQIKFEFGVMVFRKNCHLSVSVIFSIYSSKKEGEFLCLENTVRVYTSMRKQ